MNKSKHYKIIGAYDSETTNIIDNLKKTAFPCLHQLGLLNCNIEKIDSLNVENSTRIYLFRHTVELYEMLDRIASSELSYVPVIACHNLSFDMYSLAQFFENKNMRVLAKSQRKPITFTLCDEEDNPRLVIWDTLVFSQKSLSYMGSECGYEKASGAWDYSLIRTPQTPLTELEILYAKRDIYTLLAWIGYWCRLNPDIPPCYLGQRVVTKTGVVRQRRSLRFNKIRGKNLKYNVGKYHHFIIEQNKFKSDDELYTCVASTRGGFTFIARNNANVVFDLKYDKYVFGFDATSQHPSQIVSHYYPVNFTAARSEDLTRAFRIVEHIDVRNVLDRYSRPFPVAFYGCFEFVNLRLKENTIYSNLGIATLASARCNTTYSSDNFIIEENEQGEQFKTYITESGYHDEIEDPVYAFGKLESASVARLYITELSAWEIAQVYDYDRCIGIHGYMTLKYVRPSDMAVISVMQFYESKAEFKIAKECYESNKRLTNKDKLKRLGIPTFVVNGMDDCSIDGSIVDSTYLGLKADLNALFGIEACNEYRRETVLSSSGIEYVGEFGICNEPKNSKAWYQFGQRIVGWSRIAQLLVIELVKDYIDTIVNGDTDSIKVVTTNDNINTIYKQLSIMNRAIDKAKHRVCQRVRNNYKQLYSSLDEIGYYVCEFKVQQFCAGWNKAYILKDRDKFKFTIAGLPSKPLEQLATRLFKGGMTFEDICDRFLGYNTTFTHTLTGLNSRSFPEWCSMFDSDVEDHLGNVYHVTEPACLSLYPQSKTINDIRDKDNKRNMYYSLANRPSLKVNNCIISEKKIYDTKELIYGT